MTATLHMGPSFYMATSMKLLRTSTHEAENLTESTLKEAFLVTESKLKPPFPLSVPSPSEYIQLNHALVFGILTEPHLRKTHLTHLHAVNVDGYELFTTTLIKLCNESYYKLLETPRSQLLWVVAKLVEVSAVKVDSLFISLLRQINTGDFSEPNLWLCVELLEILLGNWDCLLEEPLILTSALFVYLRLMADHYRLSGGILDVLKHLEINFCIKMLRECFHLSLTIGRDLVRLLQDVVYIPDFKDLWKDLLFHPRCAGVAGFSDISDIYRVRTPVHYFLLRISPQMENQLRFLLTHVKWGNQKRYQVWFTKKHLCWPGSEAALSDIVRFICCAHHPPNEIIQSNIIARWAVIGWLLKCCRRNYFEANVKLALFYDWLFFDENVDNIMNIEPAMLLMVNSVPKYIDMAHMLLEYLFLLVDNYDIQRRGLLSRGVSTSIALLIRRGVIHSLEPLISCSVLSPVLKERLISFLPKSELAKHSSDTGIKHMVTEEESAPLIN